MDRFAAFAREQVSLLQEEENKIKTELEILWNKVDEGLRKAEDERDGKILAPLLRRRSDSPTRTGGLSSSLPAVSTMRGFAPSIYHGPRASGGTSSPRHASSRSGLSSSVAVSGFYHPRSRYQDKPRSPDTISNGGEPLNSLSLISDDVPNTPSTLSSSSTPSDGSVDLRDTLRRNMNERTDISASLQVFSVLEQAASKKRTQADAQKSKGKAKEDVKEESLSPRAKKLENAPRTSRKAGESFPSKASTGDAETHADGAGGDESKRERKRSGNKRVTFDIQPDVVTIKREVASEVEDDPISSAADGVYLTRSKGPIIY